jgi:hypothetical protein
VRILNLHTILIIAPSLPRFAAARLARLGVRECIGRIGDAVGEFLDG